MFRHLSPKAVSIVDNTAREFAERLGEPVEVSYTFHTTQGASWWFSMMKKGEGHFFMSHSAMKDWVEEEVRWRSSILARKF